MKKPPVEREIDGISLEKYTPGSVREVSASVGSWLIAEGYADPEMRTDHRDEQEFYTGHPAPREVAHDRRKHNR
jgi:hypothetical protein